MMTCPEILKKLKSLADPKAAAGMARYGINGKNMLGVSIPKLRNLAKEIGKDHQIALELWNSEIHEAHMLASMVDDPASVSEKQMEQWAADFASWDVCDQVCSNLFGETAFAWQRAVEWTGRKQEFVKRAGFVLMAVLAVHDKQAHDSAFLKFMPLIKRESGDERNFVKKAVNWAIRQIGKRNLSLNRAAIKTATEISKLDSRSAKWIAADALRELTSPAVSKQIKRTNP
jgi:3-methyladenine DNA glycosylase AlkD